MSFYASLYKPLALHWQSSRSLQICELAISYFILYHLYRKLVADLSLRRKRKRNGCKLPAKVFTWDPIFGLDNIASSLKYLQENWALDVGYRTFTAWKKSTCRVNNLGQDIIFTYEAENIKTMLATNFKSWGIGEARKDLVPIFGKGIFTTDGEAWQHSRNMLRPSFIRSQVADLQLFDHHVAHFIRAIPRDGSTIDLQPLFYSLTLDTSTEFLFGESTNALVSENYDAGSIKFVEAFNRCIGSLHGQDSKFGIWSVFLPATAQFKRDCQFVDSIVAKALANTSQDLKGQDRVANRHIFLQDLISETTDKIAIRSELLNILAAGRDTTASLLSNVWFFLSKRPEIWSCLQQEVYALGDEPITYEVLKNMTYLKALLNESLRLHPILPSNGRQAMADTILPLGGGPDETAPIFVSKGQLVVYNTYNLHRRRDIYGDDAEEFRPERWIDDGERALRPGWGYLPFNGGPRVCIGQQFALTSASYLTVRLMQEFSGIESRDPETWRESLRITLTGLGGCKVALTPKD